ncbi:uncharacterized protein GGS25DRAFT_532932 [Hypoxylon fragiforme]|uniref:uncharacterized protein n=1 Tax=Hypoxylon fragiforme TaxID=63214 RepID=UPI0020C72BBA|nr:uncharacterized protein GGS25DRAFT_532932 [Hypoxylon fragiforme]KAI2605690.1 hypothetical protein GGS25DRAFT_532932 [Hypoxylon fragiforme]
MSLAQQRAADIGDRCSYRGHCRWDRLTVTMMAPRTHHEQLATCLELNTPGAAEGTSSRAAFTRRRNKKSLGRLSLAWPNRNGQSEGWWETNYYSHPSSRLVSRTSNKQPHAHHQTRGQQHEKQKQSTNDKPVFTRRHKERVWEGRSWPTRGNNQRYQARIHVHVPCVSLRPVDSSISSRKTSTMPLILGSSPSLSLSPNPDKMAKTTGGGELLNYSPVTMKARSRQGRRRR